MAGISRTLLNPVGQNGLSFLSPPYTQPRLVTPPQYFPMTVLSRFLLGNLGTLSRTELLLRCMYYCELPSHSFSIKCGTTRARLYIVESFWSHGLRVMDVEAAFYDACMERQVSPDVFVAREGFIRMKAEDEVLGHREASWRRFLRDVEGLGVAEEAQREEAVIRLLEQLDVENGREARRLDQ